MRITLLVCVSVCALLGLAIIYWNLEPVVAHLVFK
jgi:hypothetical protein